MAFIGTVLQEVLKLRKSYLNRKTRYTTNLQAQVLKRLLYKARNTSFGKHYGFKEILMSVNVPKAYQERIPIHDYNKMEKEWWHRSLADEANIAWPGKIKNFGLTSGTSEAASKRVPVSKEMVNAIHQTSMRQFLTLPELELPDDFYKKSVLMIGGSTTLTKVGEHFEGDLSGILTKRLPKILHKNYLPPPDIRALKNWEEKLEAITENAPNWKVGIIAGVPAWTQLIFQRIIERYKLNNIHEIWPDLLIYVHGGVSFEPYRESLRALTGRNLYYLDTYLATEGYIAFENSYNQLAMQLVLNKGIYFEFVPFTQENFDVDGNVINEKGIVNIADVQTDIDYALVLTTCSGAWRYLIGDTIKFLNKEKSEIRITGRTKQFLSMCGEHLSVDNMSMALSRTAKKFGIVCNEFTVIGSKQPHTFSHHWYISASQKVKQKEFLHTLDNYLTELNDDYSTERKHALGEIKLEVLPEATFIDFLKKKGKVGGQHKFPRVMKHPSLIEEWTTHILNYEKLHG